MIRPHGEREVVGTATDKTSFKISESDTASRAELAVKILQVVEKL